MLFARAMLDSIQQSGFCRGGSPTPGRFSHARLAARCFALSLAAHACTPREAPVTAPADPQACDGHEPQCQSSCAAPTPVAAECADGQWACPAGTVLADTCPPPACDPATPPRCVADCVDQLRTADLCGEGQWSCAAGDVPEGSCSSLDVARFVDPFIGTGGVPWAAAMLFPGATTPFGMVRLSPDMCAAGGAVVAGLGTAGYFDTLTNVLGFSHTRLSGTGAVEGGQVRVSPSVRPLLPSERKSAAPALDHANERAEPGYYTALLSDIGVEVELSATPRVGVHRYTFPAGAEPHLLVDATSVLGDRQGGAGTVEVRVLEREVTGFGRIWGSFSARYGGLTVYFVARFSSDFAGFATWYADSSFPGQASASGDDVGADLRFADGTTAVEVQVALSFVSEANARENLTREVASGGFDEVRAAARREWQSMLSRVRIASDDARVRTIFYTSLYHSMIMPTAFSDTNGEYLGFDQEISLAEDFTYRTDMSLWDTFRTEHPLLVLVAPEVQRDSLKSLVRMARAGGSLPRWPSGAGYTGSMFGSPADMVIAESWLKGVTDFEVDEAYAFMRATAEAPPAPGTDGRDDVGVCLTYGYCPADRMSESVPRTLEYAWADASIALLASALGHDADAATFHARSLRYRNTFNPLRGYFQPRRADGSWVEPFFADITTYEAEALGGLAAALMDDYVEGSARQWRWTAPQDPAGLIALLGGAAPFVAELEAFLGDASSTMGATNPGSGYWHGNQHDMHAIYLFNDAGRPELTQRWVRWALDQRYDTNHAGLDGNDDGGTLSAWYVLSAMGIYPVAGTDRYWLGAPIVSAAQVVLGDDVILRVEAVGQAADALYVQEAWLGAERLCAPTLRHAQLGAGTLRFVMGTAPAPGGGFTCP